VALGYQISLLLLVAKVGDASAASLHSLSPKLAWGRGLG
jgi:hypothetical protein